MKRKSTRGRETEEKGIERIGTIMTGPGER